MTRSCTAAAARGLVLTGCALALACTPGPDPATSTSGSTTAAATDSHSTGSTLDTTPTSTTDVTTSPDTSTTGPATDASSGTTSGELPGCNGLDEASCTPRAAGDIEFECRWLTTTVVQVVGTRCEVVATPSRCVKTRSFNLGPGCYGYFGVIDGGVEVWIPVDCQEPIDAGLEVCFPEYEVLADPACVCISSEYCFSQPDEAACMAASNSLWTCGWSGDQCWQK